MVWSWLMHGSLSALRSEPLICAMSFMHHGLLALWITPACRQSVVVAPGRAQCVVLHRPYHAFLGAQVHHP
eukprot:3981458-Alexandrium_andersonii.AAC.1